MNTCDYDKYCRISLHKIYYFMLLLTVYGSAYFPKPSPTQFIKLFGLHQFDRWKWYVSVFLSSFSYYEWDCSSFTHFRALCIFFSIKYLLISFTLSSIVLVRFFYCYFPSYLFMREMNRLWYKMHIFPQCGMCLLILLIKDFHLAVHM